MTIVYSICTEPVNHLSRKKKKKDDCRTGEKGSNFGEIFSYCFCLAYLSVLIARWIHKQSEVFMALAACNDQQA